MSFVNALQMKEDFIASNGRSEESILKAEEDLKIKFAKDFHEYLEKFGLASYENHELTGLTEDKRLDVVSLTKEFREMYGSNTDKWYVIEDVGLDGIVIWQDSSGTVYKTSLKNKSIKIANSLMEYIM